MIYPITNHKYHSENETVSSNRLMPVIVYFLVAAVLTLLPCSYSAQALAKASTNKAAQLTQFIAGKVQLAQQLQQQEKYLEAINLLSELTPRQAYDQAVVHRVLGIFYWQQENIPQAIKYLSLAVESDLLAAQQTWITRRMLADILLSQQQFTEALPHYYHLVKTDELTTSATSSRQVEDYATLWLRIAQAHYQLKQWPTVISAVQKYVVTNPEGAHVQALNLQLTAQSQLQLWPEAILTLQRIILIEPNKLLWWQQLAGIQLRLEQPQAALASLILAQRQDLALSVQERRTLAQLYAQQGVPEKAALELGAVLPLLSDAQERQALLVTQAHYWQMAKEWDLAIQTWREIALTTVKYRWQLAQLLLQQGDYQAALLELNNADITQGKNKPEIAQIELAKVRAYYKLAKYDRAIVHAKQAQATSPSASAKGWIAYLTQLRRNAYRS
jgi:tetratricopeptide (TPR) repeat protein